MTGPSWGGYGPAEFDRKRCPKGAKEQPADQGALFVAAREPLPLPAEPVTVLDGQGELFAGDQP